MPLNDSSLIWDILSFRYFITPSILITVYYMGAILVPLLLWKLSLDARKKLDQHVSENIRQRLRHHISEETRKRSIIISIVIFFMMELSWRMLFEFLVAYFQIHNALTGMAA